MSFPLNRRRATFSWRCAAVLILTPVALPQAPPVELVQSLFDLTPAEARVARGLAAGKTVDDIAIAGGTSATTIRTQVRGVLKKTGCHRQVDIVALHSNFREAAYERNIAFWSFINRKIFARIIKADDACSTLAS